jgi:hypothetical protein
LFCIWPEIAAFRTSSSLPTTYDTLLIFVQDLYRNLLDLNLKVLNLHKICAKSQSCVTLKLFSGQIQILSRIKLASFDSFLSHYEPLPTIIIIISIHAHIFRRI